MSSFLCHNNHFQFLADVLYTELISPRDRDIRRVIGLDVNVEPEEGAIKFINELIDLNVFALKERYGEGLTDNELNPPYIKTAVSVWDYNFHQFIKALSCLRYQCAEGVAVDTENYKRLNDLINFLCFERVENETMYSLAEWEITEPRE